jgi:hypothetical protein
VLLEERLEREVPKKVVTHCQLLLIELRFHGSSHDPLPSNRQRTHTE